jgi:hypothetical protein
VSIWEGRKDRAGHHCPNPSCATFNKDCFTTKLHAAFCLVIVDFSIGQKRFCGLRFAVESPSGCAKHPNSSYSENKIFAATKKEQSYKLPKFFPHEAPGWKMQMSSGFGSMRMPLEMYMNVKGGELGFIATYAPQGRRKRIFDLGKIPNRELRMTEGRVVEDTAADEPEADELSREMAILKLNEKEGRLFTYEAPHTIFQTVKNDIKTQQDWARQHARKAFQAEAQAKTTKTDAKKKVSNARDSIKKVSNARDSIKKKGHAAHKTGS